ncbi:MAG: autotransporter-associated beta strand repeat-containing protein, partial [Pirellulales bacterium]|nr:autotransporter-associated beta strand repeat-containing protein [Pirellulales bacterium]
MNRFLRLFCFFIIAGLMISASAWGEDNAYWTGDGTIRDLSDPGDGVNPWVYYDGSGNNLGGGTPYENRLFINTTNSSAYPIFDGAGFYSSLTAWDLLIGTTEDWCSGVYAPSGPGQLDQTGGVLDLYYALHLGAIYGETSTYNLSGGTLNKINDGGNIEIGINGGTGVMTVGSTAEVNCNYGMVIVGYGIDSSNHSSNGTLTTSGTFNMANHTLYLAPSGGEGYVNVNGGTMTVAETLLGEGNYDSQHASWANNYAELNLNGGVLATPYIKAGYYWGTGGVGANATINFNGGTLRATNESGNFLNANGSTNFNAVVLAGGAVIDTTGYYVKIAQPLVSGAAPDGGLTKVGSGTLALGAVNTYNGPTVVAQGALEIGSTASISTSSNVTVNGGAMLAFRNAAGATVGGLDLDDGSTLRLSVPGLASAYGGITTGNLDVTGTGTRTIILDTASTAAPYFDTATPYNAINYTALVGTGTVNARCNVRGYSAAVSTTPSPVTITVTGAAAPAAALYWNAQGNGDWDTVATQNWTTSGPIPGTPDYFYMNDNVIFNDPSGTTMDINLVGRLIPGSVTFEGISSYNLVGSGYISNYAGAPVGITLASTYYGKVTISNTGIAKEGVADNDFNGDVNVLGGTLEFPRSDALGFNNTVIVNAATLNATGEWVMGNGQNQDLTVSNFGQVNVAGNFYAGRGSGATSNVTMNTYANMTVTGNEIYVGYDGGTGSLTLHDANVTNGDPLSGGYGYIQIGRGTGGDGTLIMTGASTLYAGEEFRAGWIGGAGDVQLSDTSQIIARGFQNMGRDAGSVLYVNMTGSSKMSCTWNEMRFGSNGGEAHIVMDGDSEADPVGLGNFAPGGDCWYLVFGEDSGSVATLEMHNYSTILTPYEAYLGKNGGQASVAMDGHAKIQASFISFAEDAGSSALLELDDSAQLYSTGEIRLGAGGSMTTTMSGSSQINADGNLHVGIWGASSTVTMNPGTSMHVGGNEFQINAYGAGASSVTMDEASIEVQGEIFVAWDDAATGTLEMDDSSVTSHSNVQVGRRGNGTLTMTGASTFHADGEFRLGICGGIGTLNMSGTSVLEASNLERVGANPDWDNSLPGTAYITLTGGAALKSNGTLAMGIDGGSATVTMGTLGGTDTATMSCSDWFNLGGYGGSIVMKMYANTSFTSTTQGTIAESDGTYADFQMFDNAHFTAPQIRVSGGNGANGTIQMSGTSNMTSTGWFGLAEATGSSATVTLSGSASMVGEQFAVGDADGSTASVIMTGSSSVTGNVWVAVSNNGGANGTMNVYDSSTLSTPDLQIAWGGTGVVNVGNNNGTATLNAGQIELAYEDDDNGGTNADATLNLNQGGVVETGSIQSASDSGTPLSSVLNFDGGVLKATASSTTFVSNVAGSSTFEANVLEGGAIVDTQSYTDTITEELQHASGVTQDGGLTKLGVGALTLSVAPSYDGDTDVMYGTLNVPSLNTPSADVTAYEDATLNAGSITANTLTIGAPLPPAAAGAAPVPEPSTWILLILAGLGGLAAAR